MVEVDLRFYVRDLLIKGITSSPFIAKKKKILNTLKPWLEKLWVKRDIIFYLAPDYMARFSLLQIIVGKCKLWVKHIFCFNKRPFLVRSC
jgi:hypothetical protein